MIATPAYSPQTRSEQRRTIERGASAFVWTLALEFNANAMGIRERLVTLMEWPYTGHIPYVPVTGMTEPLLILLQMEIAANLPSVRVTPFLLPRSEMATFADYYRFYQWPDLVVDKICVNCGAVWPALYDEEIGCCGT